MHGQAPEMLSQATRRWSRPEDCLNRTMVIVQRISFPESLLQIECDSSRCKCYNQQSDRRRSSRAVVRKGAANVREVQHGKGVQDVSAYATGVAPSQGLTGPTKWPTSPITSVPGGDIRLKKGLLAAPCKHLQIYRRRSHTDSPSTLLYCRLRHLVGHLRLHIDHGIDQLIDHLRARLLADLLYLVQLLLRLLLSFLLSLLVA